MKTILFLFSIILLTNCTVYHYTTVESKSIKKNEQAVFAEESDTMRIEYNFSGLSGPVVIRIVNKTDRPLYVDWKRSSLIVNGKAVSYYNPDAQINGTISSQSLQLSNQFSTGQAAINADLRVQPGVTFIPPAAYTQNTYINLSSVIDDRIPNEEMKREEVILNQISYRLRKIDFSETNTPAFFKSYITFILGDNNEQHFFKQHDFYIASSIKTAMRPVDIYNNKIPGNTFFTRHSTGVGTAFGVTTVLGAITLAAIAAPDNQHQ